MDFPNLIVLLISFLSLSLFHFIILFPRCSNNFNFIYKASVANKVFSSHIQAGKTPLKQAETLSGTEPLVTISTHIRLFFFRFRYHFNTEAVRRSCAALAYLCKSESPEFHLLSPRQGDGAAVKVDRVTAGVSLINSEQEDVNGFTCRPPGVFKPQWC